MTDKEIERCVSGIDHNSTEIINDGRVDEAIKPLGCFALILAIVCVVIIIWGLSA